MKKEKSLSFFLIIKRLFILVIKSCPLYFIIYALIDMCQGVSYGINTHLLQVFFDQLVKTIHNQVPYKNVIILAVLLGVLLIFIQLLNGLANFMYENLIKKLKGSLTFRVNEKAADLNPILYEETNELDKINKAHNGMENSVEILFSFISIFTFHIPYFIYMEIYLFKLQPLLSLAFIFMFVPMTCLQYFKSKIFFNLEDKSAPVRREYEYYEKCMSDKEYLKETRLLGIEDYFSDLTKKALDKLNQLIMEAERRSAKIEFVGQSVTLFGYLLIMVILVYSVMNRQIGIGAWGAVFASIGLVFGIIQDIIQRNIGFMSRNLGLVRNFINFLDMPVEQKREEAVDMKKGIVCKNVSFKYPDAEEYALKNINLNITDGEIIALVGENGSGKTTLTKLLLGLFEPTKGDVIVGGKNTKEVSRNSFRAKSSAVFQNFSKYKLTLRENVGISDFENMDSDSDTRSALAKVEVDFSKKVLPNDLDTVLSSEFEGVDLSGGQWQKVAIARGIYKEHDFIVLDEPTSAIDPVQETELYQNFKKISEGKTALLVTHRLGSAKMADKIIVLDKHQIVESGTHEELMKKKGKYQEMFMKQAQWYKTSD
ncbi:ABC transporter ATP-binding protein [Anaeromicropila populeti]|uniref:ATP-binding cassette, subfamily B n=1 Tax=Anaeromicropila populeti TaxID=37658 RepID=A0A1I6K718_9FIRM|nr:ABC transporter ATP-binding protein [Anaeromicropila populeti]SFR87019.1 ATP-binding cassette, subfamily B [Anaeromicropila populeti]